MELLKPESQVTPSQLEMFMANGFDRSFLDSVTESDFIEMERKFEQIGESVRIEN